MQLPIVNVITDSYTPTALPMYCISVSMVIGGHSVPGCMWGPAQATVACRQLNPGRTVISELLCQRHTVLWVGVCCVCNSISRRTLKLSTGECSTGTSAMLLIIIINNNVKISQKLIYSLRFLNKGFVHSLWNYLLTSNDVVAHSRHAEEKSAHTTDLFATWNYTVEPLYNSDTLEDHFRCPFYGGVLIPGVS